MADKSTDKVTEAQATLAAARRLRDDEARQATTMGVWMIGDAKYAGWIVHRCGLAKDPRAQMEFKRLVSSGVYRAAPAGTRCGLYASDGDEGLYVITHPEALAEIRAQQKANIEAQIARATGGQLPPGLAALADRTGASPEVRMGFTREILTIQPEA